MKCIIVYKSKTGFTKKYAGWIQEELCCDLKSYKKVTKEMLAPYDMVIFGSYIRAGIIHGWKRMRRLVGEDTDKLIVFTTGATPEAVEKQIDATWKRNASKEELEKTPHYYMQSGLNYEKMSVFDKIMMKGLLLALNRKRKKSQEDMEMIRRISHSYDASSKKFVTPLVEYVKSKQ